MRESGSYYTIRCTLVRLAKAPIWGSRLPGRFSYSRKGVLCDFAYFSDFDVGLGYLLHTHTHRGKRAQAYSYYGDGAPLGCTYKYLLEVKACPAERGREKSPPPIISSDPLKMRTLWALRDNPARPGPICLCKYEPGWPYPPSKFQRQSSTAA